MYKYDDLRPSLFTEEGVDLIIKIRDRAFELCKLAGACTVDKAMQAAIATDTWKRLAAIDYLIERGDLRRITEGLPLMGQDHVLVRAS